MCQFSHVKEKKEREKGQGRKGIRCSVCFGICARKRVNYCQGCIIEAGALLHLPFSVYIVKTIKKHVYI